MGPARGWRSAPRCPPEAKELDKAGTARQPLTTSPPRQTRGQRQETVQMERAQPEASQGGPTPQRPPGGPLVQSRRPALRRRPRQGARLQCLQQGPGARRMAVVQTPPRAALAQLPLPSAWAARGARGRSSPAVEGTEEARSAGAMTAMVILEEAWLRAARLRASRSRPKCSRCPCPPSPSCHRFHHWGPQWTPSATGASSKCSPHRRQHTGDFCARHDVCRRSWQTPWNTSW
mmetsp:Transcript_84617/g.261884  ORF Transcript_84617/g.261884 Transcript_84617/m.261884 type:complete len:233 (+) Transcript_84617:257-955(+)